MKVSKQTRTFKWSEKNPVTGNLECSGEMPTWVPGIGPRAGWGSPTHQHGQQLSAQVTARHYRVMQGFEGFFDRRRLSFLLKYCEGSLTPTGHFFLLQKKE
jgi:hypothetical protein